MNSLCDFSQEKTRQRIDRKKDVLVLQFEMHIIMLSLAKDDICVSSIVKQFASLMVETHIRINLNIVIIYCELKQVYFLLFWTMNVKDKLIYIIYITI